MRLNELAESWKNGGRSKLVGRGRSEGPHDFARTILFRIYGQPVIDTVLAHEFTCSFISVVGIGLLLVYV
jgi:hypothetical protein